MASSYVPSTLGKFCFTLKYLLLALPKSFDIWWATSPGMLLEMSCGPAGSEPYKDLINLVGKIDIRKFI